MNTGTYRYWAWNIMAFVILVMGFYNNSWKVADPKLIKNKPIISESMVMGRLAQSQKEGLFTGGGFMGWVLLPGDTLVNYPYQYDAYLKEKPFDGYHPYYSLTGFQGFIYSLSDSISPFSNSMNIAIYRGLNALLLALGFLVIINWFFYYFGIISALTVLAGLALSPSLATYSNNLFFTLWAFYVPFIAVVAILFLEEKRKYYSPRIAGWVVFTAVFIKCLFNGFEFITTTLFMVIIPVIFYGLKNQWNMKHLANRVILFGSLTIAAIVMTMVILSVQISIYKGENMAGPGHILKSLVKRTHGSGGGFQFDERISKSLQADIVSVIKYQLKTEAIDLNHTKLIRKRHPSLELTEGEILMIVTILSLAIIILGKIISAMPVRGSPIIALICTTFISLLGPLSWFIIFKGHTSIHIELDRLAWLMPFLLFAFALSGAGIDFLTRQLKKFLFDQK